MQLFYAYSTADARYRDQLEKQLQQLKSRGVLAGWESRAIAPGSGWRREVSPHVTSADVVLFLMSADLIASGYCDGSEAGTALLRQRRGDARVYAVLLRPCNMKSTAVAGLPVLPRDGKPVTRWSNTDGAFQAIAAGIAGPSGTAGAAATGSAAPVAVPGAARVGSAVRATNGRLGPADIALSPDEIGPEFVALDQPKDRGESAAGESAKFVTVARAGSRRVAQLVFRASDHEDALSRLSTAVHAELGKGAHSEPVALPADAPEGVSVRRVSMPGGGAPNVSTFAAKGRFLVAAKVMGGPAEDTSSGEASALSERVVHQMLARIPE